MEEIRNEGAVLLDQGDLEKVAGGNDEEVQTLKTLDEIENSPIFDKLKKQLRKYKDAGYSKKADSTVTDLVRYALSLGYFVSSLAGIKFVKKYWDLV